MLTTHVENLSVADLKSQRTEIADALAANNDVERKELAARYVQARLDAKLRDEKLAEQAKTIEMITAGNGVLDGRVTELLQLCKAHREIAEENAASRDEMQKTFRESVERYERDLQQLHELLESTKRELGAELKAESDRSARLKLAAARMHAAGAAAAKALNDALSAQAIEAADQV